MKKEKNKILPKKTVELSKVFAKGIDMRGYKEAEKKYAERQKQAVAQAKNILKAKESFFK